VDGYPPGLPSRAGNSAVAKTETTSHGELITNGNGLWRIPNPGDGAALTATAPVDEGFEEFGGSHAPPPPTPGTTYSQPNQRLPSVREIGTTGKKSRANIKIATLNMKGRKSTRNASTLGSSRTNKWSAIAKVMKTRRIGILALQETHLSEKDYEEVTKNHEKWALVFNSADADRAGSSAGVAFVINKNIVPISDVKFTELIPGRAIAMTAKWYRNETITLINVYGPTDDGKQAPFWPEVTEEWTKINNWPKADFIMGDFNLVEENFDRAPVRPDEKEEVNTLKDFRINLNAVDAWRNTYPTEGKFTFRSNVRRSDDGDDISCSRIDRIYVNRDVEEQVYEWDHVQSEVPTDHMMVSVRYAPTGAPEVGEGRPTMPLL
jgi:exonuclease III